jgi:hypothetical protein
MPLLCQWYLLVCQQNVQATFTVHMTQQDCANECTQTSDSNKVTAGMSYKMYTLWTIYWASQGMHGRSSWPGRAWTGWACTV